MCTFSKNHFGTGHSLVFSVIQVENEIQKFPQFQSEFEWNKFMHCSRAEIGCSGQFGGGPKLLDIYVKLSTRPDWQTYQIKYRFKLIAEVHFQISHAQNEKDSMQSYVWNLYKIFLIHHNFHHSFHQLGLVFGHPICCWPLYFVIRRKPS